MAKNWFLGLSSRVLMLIVAGLLALSYMTIAVNPAQAWVVTVLGLLFVPLSVVNFLLILWALKRRSKAIAIPLLAFLPALLFLGRYIQFGGSDAEPADGRKMKVISYNVGAFYLYDEDSGIEGRKQCADSVFAFLKSQDADIICLQEDNGIGGKMLAKLNNMLPYHKTVQVGGGPFYNRLGVYSRFPILKTEEIDYGSRGNGSVAFFLKVYGDTVIVINNHFESNKLSGEDRNTYKDMLKGNLNEEQTKRLVKELDNPATFKRTHRVPSLSADNSRYKANGRYWQGGVWPGTNYMVMNGLKQKGFEKEAREIALNHYDQVFQVYKKTNTFFEYYAPESTEPGFMARKDFIGWTGLAPIAELIEFIIGIRGDYTNKKIVWDMNLTEANGIERYPFGPEGLITLKANGRRSAADKPKIEVESNVDFQLVVRYGDKEETFQVVAGKNNF